MHEDLWIGRQQEMCRKKELDKDKSDEGREKTGIKGGPAQGREDACLVTWPMPKQVAASAAVMFQSRQHLRARTSKHESFQIIPVVEI